MIRPLSLLLTASLALGAITLPQTAQAQLQVDITQGNIDPLPIAIPDFQQVGDLGELGADYGGGHSQ